MQLYVMKKPALIVVAIFYQCFLFAQDSTLQRLIRVHQKPIIYTNNTFSGDGWQMLLGKIDSTRFTLIGEDHGMAEIPAFTKALLKHKKFDHFVAEIDPITANIALELTKVSLDSLKKLHQTQVEPLSFYSLSEEFEIIRTLAERKMDFWGLEQISMFSDKIIFDYLKKNVKTPKGKMAASDMLNRAIDSTAKIQGVSFFSFKKKGYEDFKTALLEENEDIQETTERLLKSYKIYQSGEHTPRIKLMKHEWQCHFDRLSSTQKAHDNFLFKFGANHAAQGLSPHGLNLNDVGSIVSNVADTYFESSFHILIVGANGEQASPMAENGYSKINIMDANNGMPCLKPFLQNLDKKQWSLFNLKPMRRAFEYGDLKITDFDLIKTILGYDVLVVIPQATRSHIIDKYKKY